MAKTIAISTGCDSNRDKRVHRLGSQHSIAEANTWRTFSKVHINADGSGHFELKRDGEIIHTWKWGKESGS